MAKKSTERQRRYDSEHTCRIGLKLNKTSDADILEKLDSVVSKQGYIKDLIRRDISNCVKSE